jgi:hypothetical protein
MTRRGGWLAWPEGWLRVGVVYLVAVATVAVVVKYPGVLDQHGGEASRNSALSYADREIAGGNGVVADQDAVYAARGIIPEDEAYRIAVNPDYPGGTDLTVPHVESYYHYFLMPRRVAADAHWVICYACDLEQYGPGFEVVWEGDEGVSIVRIG